MESVDQLLKRISKAGIKPAYLRRLLPTWAVDYPPANDTALLELKLHLAKDLGLELASLEENQTVSFGSLPSTPKFKRIRRSQPKQLGPAASMFYALARALAAACPKPFSPLPQDPLKLRRDILDLGSLVTTNSLLRYLWSMGIPVAHYADWPDNLSRPSAMAVDVDGRPVIIVGSARKELAWHAFYLAHEAGHIALGHVGRNEILIDAEEGFGASEGDDQEEDADNYGLLLLAGAKEVALPKGRSVDDLSQSARTLGKESKIDRGHLILRYGMESNLWPIAIRALQQAEPDADASLTINHDHAEAQLAFDRLSSERQEYLHRVLALS